MSDVTLNVLDSARAIQGRTHAGLADRLIAALSADPVTIEELESALARFEKPHPDQRCFQDWAAGTDERPWDAGIVLIDLAARLVAVQSSCSSPMQRGQECYHDGETATEHWLPFHIASEWQIVSGDIDDWQRLAEERRRKRRALSPLDTREVVYGKLAESLASECLTERRRVGSATAGERPIFDIHVRWLMTPRKDLRGQSPRDVFFAHRHHIDMDLQDRAHSWSMLGCCPPSISRQSHAFRFGGFGTHEWVIHYELVRELLSSCWDKLAALTDAELSTFSLGDEIARLTQLQDDWLNSPHMEYHGMPPEQVIIHERCRLPIAMGGEHAMIDDDCPVCRMMSSGEFGPMFWHLDGCNMDEDFAFSYHDTREEYEKEQHKWEEHSRKYNEEHAEELAQLRAKEEASIWKTSYFDPHSMVTGKPGPGVWIMGLGMHAAELSEDLKAANRSDLRSDLNQFFDNLNEAYRNQPELVEPVAQRLTDCLQSISQACPALAAKCEDLQDQLAEFSSTLNDWLENPPPGWKDDDQDGMPF